MTHGGILSGQEIAEAWSLGKIRISDFDKQRLNPASYDLKLGSQVAVYRDCVYFVVGGRAYYAVDDRAVNELGEELNLNNPFISQQMAPHLGAPLDARKKNEVFTFDIPPEGWLLKPGIGYLMHTDEHIMTEEFVPVLDGKSSLGRLFMTAHVTAGYGDPGFDGQYTLEVVVTHPVIVYPGMRFCQIRFHTLVGAAVDYSTRGHYTGQAAEGPVPSMSWKQFEEEEARNR